MHMHWAQEKQKAQYDKHRRHVAFDVGDRVLLATDHIALEGPRKFKAKFIGPFVVRARVGDLAYRLDLPTTMRMHPVFHVDRLKRFVAGGGDGHQPPPPVLQRDGDAPEFEVERIVA